MVDNVNAGHDVYTTMVAMTAIMGPLAPEVALPLEIGLVLTAAITSGTIAPYTTALANASLWSRIDCAIYLAIVADGNVTAANFAAMRAAVNAVSFADSGVKATVLACIDALGWQGLAQLAQTSGTYAGACGGCGNWCYAWGSFTGAPAMNLNWSPIVVGGTPYAVWSGSEFTGVYTGGNTEVQIEAILPFAVGVGNVEVKYTNVDGGNGSDRYVGYSLGGGAITTLALDSAVGTKDYTVAPAANVDHLYISVRTRLSGVLVANKISGIKVAGSVVNPWGTSNC